MITIATRFRPFSHSTPTRCLLPASSLAACIWPAQVQIFHSGTQERLLECPVPFGPLKQFSVTLDLEQGCIVVSGFAKNGYIRYRITNKEIVGEKGWDFKQSLPENDDFQIYKNNERLSFGCHKAQDVAAIWRRGTLGEILPFIYALAGWYPQNTEAVKDEGSLFSEAYAAIQEHAVNEVYEKLHTLMQASFEQLFFPQLLRTSLLGFHVPAFASASILGALQKWRSIIRSLVLQEKEDGIHMLPVLPKEFHCGRGVDFFLQKGHKIAFEWTKKAMRTLFVEAACDDICSFIFPKDTKQFRVRIVDEEEVHTYLNHAPIPLSKGKKYFFDRFEK